jgi:hypothetical protein
MDVYFLSVWSWGCGLESIEVIFIVNFLATLQAWQRAHFCELMTAGQEDRPHSMSACRHV